MSDPAIKGITEVRGWLIKTKDVFDRRAKQARENNEADNNLGYGYSDDDYLDVDLSVVEADKFSHAIGGAAEVLDLVLADLIIRGVGP